MSPQFLQPVLKASEPTLLDHENGHCDQNPSRRPGKRLCQNANGQENTEEDQALLLHYHRACSHRILTVKWSQLLFKHGNVVVLCAQYARFKALHCEFQAVHGVVERGKAWCAAARAVF